jgi:hypothetical protein
LKILEDKRRNLLAWEEPDRGRKEKAEQCGLIREMEIQNSCIIMRKVERK